MRSSRSGLSLLEVMISVSILTFVSVGVLTAFSHYESLVVRQRIREMLEIGRTNIFNRLQDDRAWRRTIRNAFSGVAGEDNPELGCLFDQSDCDPGRAGPAWFDITPTASVGDVGLYNLTWRFGHTAAPCTRPVGGYDIADPDEDLHCPVRFEVLGNFNCDGVNACHPSSIEIVMRPLLSAAFVNKYGAFQTSVDPVTRRPTGCRYCLHFTRGIASIEQSFTVREVFTNPVTSGACAVGGVAMRWVERVFNTVESDSDNLVGSGQVQLAAGRVRLAPGRFKCRAQAPGRAVGAFRIRATVTSGNAIINQNGTDAVAFAGMSLGGNTTPTIRQEATALLEFEVRSTDGNTSDIAIEQFCERTNSTQDLGGRFGAAGVQTRYAKLECRRLY